MCGIIGIFDFRGAPDWTELERLNGTMVHRGPDEDGMFLEGPVGLAMRRLSIVDVSEGHQPMETNDGRHVIVFNGECYNYGELRTELERTGVSFRTHSDTETILYGYQRWGPAVLDRMVGMWGLAIYDRRDRTLFLARDRLGKKQLYYRHDERRLVFASEMATVLHANLENRLRRAALPEFLNYSYVSGGGLTAVEGVHLLPEGHWALVNESGRLELQRYWDLRDVPEQPVSGESEAAEAAYEIAMEAVRIRLVSSDVPVSVMLSSGLDSGTIAYVLARELGARLQTFSVGFADGDFDEATDAGEFARQMDMPWERELVTARDVAADFQHLIGHASSLQANTAHIVYYYTNRMVRRSGFKVALNGNGGDELFAGYPTYRATNLYRYYSRLPKVLRQGIAAMVDRIPAAHGRLSLDYVAKKYSACPYDDPLQAHGYWRTIYSPTELDELLTPGWRPAAGRFTSIYDSAYAELGENEASINTLMRADFKAWLTPMLPWVDNISMAHSVELRFPFLDHRLVEFALGLPSTVLFRGWKMKRLMKRFLRGRLPDKVLYRRKRGTHIPLSRWLNGELQPLARHYLDAAVLNRHGLFNMRMVDRLVREHGERRADHTFKLWNLVVYSAWSERFRIQT